MRNVFRVSAVAVAGTAAVGLFAGPASAATPSGGPPSGGHAVFVETDDPAGNSVVAYRQNADGTLTQSRTYPTGGNGGILQNSVVDHTASEGAVTYDARHQLLYVVNAGSDTVSVFGVHGSALDLHQVVPSGGSFPASIAVHDNIVYVLNGHDGGSIQGYVVVAGFLVRIPAWTRPLGLDPTKLDFTQSPGQIVFTPDGRKLVVSTKANGNDIDVFAVDPIRGPSAQPIVTNLPGTVPFAFAFDSYGHLAVAETGVSTVATFAVNADGTLTGLADTPTGQKGTCWVVSRGDQLFATNPGSASVTTLRTDAAGVASLVANAATDAGTVDPVVSADGRFLYVETGAAGVVDEFRIATDGTLTRIGSVTVPDAVGAEGIAAA
jgi:6-phosphogluconolactonase (cycloisomerase 2 family)